MFAINELNIKVLLSSDVNGLQKLCSLNQYYRNICNHKSFWQAKFKHDNLPILVNNLNIKEYKKVIDCRNKAKKIIIVNDIETNIKNGNNTSGDIIIDVTSDQVILLIDDVEIEEFVGKPNHRIDIIIDNGSNINI